MMQVQIAKKILTKTAFLLVPLFLLTGIYFYFDPFRVIHKYDNFYPPNRQYVIVNRDYVSTEVFLRNYPKYKYDSFIFGSSRSLFYFADQWKQHIHSKKIFHFDASGENIYGIFEKIQFLRTRKVEIKNALILLDYETLYSVDNSSKILYTHHPLLSGENKFSFQLKFFKAFLNAPFCIAFLDRTVSGKFRHYMEGTIQSRKFDYDDFYNEIRQTEIDSLVTNHPSEYYTERRNIFYERDTGAVISSACLGTIQTNYLHSIAEYLDKNNADYKIIISPLYNQEYFNPDDLQKLFKIFGREHVYDFSGINFITRDFHHYYETSHYRPEIAAMIMDSIYTNKY